MRARMRADTRGDDAASTVTAPGHSRPTSRCSSCCSSRRPSRASSTSTGRVNRPRDRKRCGRRSSPPRKRQSNCETTSRCSSPRPKIWRRTRRSQVLAHPDGCTLTFAGIGGPDRSHLDLVRPDGTVACSSRPIAAREGASYGRTSWLRRALTRPLFLAPVLDERTGDRVAVATTPIAGGKGVVAAFADLASLAPALASQYGGGRATEFSRYDRAGRMRSSPGRLRPSAGAGGNSPRVRWMPPENART